MKNSNEKNAAKRAKAMFSVSLLLSVSACAGVGREHDEAAVNADADRLWVRQVNHAAAGQSTFQGSTKANSALAQEPVSSYTVQAGDGLADIARRVTGSPGNWRAIAEYNDLADPNALRVGDTLSIPPSFLAGGRSATSNEDEFDSGTHESSRAVDLLDVLSEAQDYDADFQAAIKSRSISQRSIPIARSAQLPQVALGYTGGYYDFESDSSDEYVGQQLTLTLSQSIYDRAKAQSDLAVASEITARAELDGALEALEVSTGTSMTGDIAPLMQTISLGLVKQLTIHFSRPCILPCCVVRRLSRLFGGVGN